MTISRFVYALLIAGLALVNGLSAQATRGFLARDNFIITNVSVIPMTSDTVIRDASVLVRNGRIAELGRTATVRAPAGTRTVDGRGKFLIPGLADMHAHLYADENAVHDSVAPFELGVMLANGVTTARLMIGTPEHFALRRGVENGSIAGPQLWVASPQFAGRADINSRVITTPEEARIAVREMKNAGYDFIKLTLFITRPVYDAIVDEARRSNIPVVGHVDPQVGVARALEAGQQIEHHDNYLESILADSSPIKTSVSDRGVFFPQNWQSLDHIDDRKLAAIAGATARANVFTTPTLYFFLHTMAIRHSDEEIRARPDWAFTPPSVRTSYMAARERYWSTAASEQRRQRYVQVRNKLVKAIVDSGGKIMAGSDAPGWLLAYGYTLHRELEAMVDAGLSPYQALLTATRNPAEFLNATSEWGTLERGKRADMILLSANPMESIRNTTKIEAVSLGGKWFPVDSLQRMTNAAAIRLGGSSGR